MKRSASDAQGGSIEATISVDDNGKAFVAWAMASVGPVPLKKQRHPVNGRSASPEDEREPAAVQEEEGDRELPEIEKLERYDDFASTVRKLKRVGRLDAAVKPILERLAELAREACPDFAWLLHFQHPAFETDNFKERADRKVFFLDKQDCQEWLLAETAWLITAAYLDGKTDAAVQALFDSIPKHDDDSVVNGIRIGIQREQEERGLIRPAIDYLRD